MQFAIPEMLHDDPILCGPVAVAGQPIIVSKRGPTTLMSVDILDVFSTFDYLFVAAYSTCCIITAVLLVAFASMSRRGKRCSFERIWFRKTRIKFMRRLAGICWRMVELILDQENYVKPHAATRMLWSCFVLATFVIIFGYVWNLLSVDMVAVIPSPNIDNVEDLLSPTFKHVRPLTVSNFYTLSIIKGASKTSSMHKLYKHMMTRKNESLVNIDIASSSEKSMKMMTRVMNAMQTGDEALLVFRFLLQFLKSEYCHLRPDFTQTMYISRESMHETFLVFMYNKRINGELRRFYDYRLRTVDELAILERMITSLLETVRAELAP